MSNRARPLHRPATMGHINIAGNAMKTCPLNMPPMANNTPAESHALRLPAYNAARKNAGTQISHCGQPKPTSKAGGLNQTKIAAKAAGIAPTCAPGR